MPNVTHAQAHKVGLRSRVSAAARPGTWGFVLTSSTRSTGLDQHLNANAVKATATILESQAIPHTSDISPKPPSRPILTCAPVRVACGNAQVVAIAGIAS